MREQKCQAVIPVQNMNTANLNDKSKKKSVIVNCLRSPAHDMHVLFFISGPQDSKSGPRDSKSGPRLRKSGPRENYLGAPIYYLGAPTS